MQPSNVHPVAFEDIVEADEAKRCLLELSCLPRVLPAAVFRGMRTLPQSVLLYGPPGGGKTMLAHALAHCDGRALFELSPATALSKWAGEGEKHIRAVFQAALALAPSVIFVDEIDALAASRSGSAGKGDGSSGGRHSAGVDGKANGGSSGIGGQVIDTVSRRVLTELLLGLNGLSNHSAPSGALPQSQRAPSRGSQQPTRKVTPALLPVIFVAATNRPEDLDDALLRRFDRRILVPLPGPSARAQLLRRHLTELGCELRDEEYAWAALATEGWNCADIQSMCQEAATAPLRDLVIRLGRRMTDSNVTGATAGSSPPIAFQSHPDPELTSEQQSNMPTDESNMQTDESPREGCASSYLVNSIATKTGADAPNSNECRDGDEESAEYWDVSRELVHDFREGPDDTASRTSSQSGNGAITAALGLFKGDHGQLWNAAISDNTLVQRSVPHYAVSPAIAAEPGPLCLSHYQEAESKSGTYQKEPTDDSLEPGNTIFESDLRPLNNVDVSTVLENGIREGSQMVVDASFFDALIPVDISTVLKHQHRQRLKHTRSQEQPKDYEANRGGSEARPNPSRSQQQSRNPSQTELQEHEKDNHPDVWHGDDVAEGSDIERYYQALMHLSKLPLGHGAKSSQQTDIRSITLQDIGAYSLSIRLR
jgi:SpoVK/Ycf46/Vps4 family AAA+-type ATPase